VVWWVLMPATMADAHAVAGEAAGMVAHARVLHPPV